MQGRILIAGLRGSGGKTALSLALIAAWRSRGIRVIPFKKGPDYIDAAWLALAAGEPCSSLDSFLMGDQAVRICFAERTRYPGLAVIEGNRGLFDGLDQRGTYSTAALARLLDVSVVLVVDAVKTTRTAAALVLGCQHLEPGLPLRGVILNRVAGSRHEKLMRQCIEAECGIPVLGAVPSLSGIELPERHLGLLPSAEHPEARRVIATLARAAEQYLDLDALQTLAQSATFFAAEPPTAEFAAPLSGPPVRIGVVRDAAFQFYYPENLEALARRSARLIEVNALTDPALPDLDALYLGGGFPETQAAALAANESFRTSVREAVAAGLPVYAECGGVLFLGESLTFQGRTFPMAGALPITFSFSARPQGHGYTEFAVEAENPFFPVGTRLRGHEFHYSRVQSWQEASLGFAFRLQRGQGFDGKRDGITKHNVLATYSHVHALGHRAWAEGIVARARVYQRDRLGAEDRPGSPTASLGYSRKEDLEAGFYLAAKSGLISKV